MVRQRIRIRFRKQDDLRLLGHRDLLRLWERLLRRCQLELSLSGGFHPRPKINFPSALAVGIAGHDEVLELELAGETPVDEVRQRLAAQAPAGLVVETVEQLPEGSRPSQVASMTFELPIPPERCESLAGRIAALLAGPSQTVDRGEGKKPVDLLDCLSELRLADGRLHLRMRVTGQASARPRDFLAALELEDLEHQGCHLTRTQVELQS